MNANIGMTSMTDCRLDDKSLSDATMRTTIIKARKITKLTASIIPMYKAAFL